MLNSTGFDLFYMPRFITDYCWHNAMPCHFKGLVMYLRFSMAREGIDELLNENTLREDL